MLICECLWISLCEDFVFSRLYLPVNYLLCWYNKTLKNSNSMRDGNMLRTYLDSKRVLDNTMNCER